MSSTAGPFSIITAIILPAAVGGLLAALALGGLVFSQTQGPDKNPASQEILVYGN